MYGYPQPPPPPQKSGLPVVVIVVLVILGVMVLGVGLLAVLGIFGTRKYLAAAKTAEATSSIGHMQKLAEQAYDRESMDDLVLGEGNEAGGHKLCASASKPVPSTIADVAAKKYMSAPGEWLTDEKTHGGFACLKFEMTMPQYYQYDYKATASSYTATARGDLDGDGEVSTFEGAGSVDSASHTVKNALLVVKNADE